MPGSEYEKVLDLAADQFGYVSTSQAVARGVSNNALRMMATRGVLERVSWGVYRLPTFPASPFAEYMEASLWPAGVRGVISHESALAIRDLSDVTPPKVHLTLPRYFRVRREVPGHLTIHNAELSDGEIDLVEGIPTTTVRRTIDDCHQAKLGPTLLRQAIDEAERDGYLAHAEAEGLRTLVQEGTHP
jgi:predicted transcriptional regulator of viral defense system